MKTWTIKYGTVDGPSIEWNEEIKVVPLEDYEALKAQIGYSNVAAPTNDNRFAALKSYTLNFQKQILSIFKQIHASAQINLDQQIKQVQDDIKRVERA